jgi:uncharacterized membrane protein
MVPVVTSKGGASRRRRLLLVALVVASAALAAGVAARVVASHSLDLTNLVWNLFLAWIPFVVALALYDCARRRAAATTQLALGAVWLVFLPNAPYIATDVIWLGDLDSGTYWHDPLLIGVAAGLGLVLGFLSLYLVQAVVAARLGRVVGWTVAVGALLLSGLGVYLGRYERWNSWEVLTEPGKIFGGLAAGLADPLAYPRPLALSAFFAIACCAGYAAFYSVFRPHLSRLEDR